MQFNFRYIIPFPTPQLLFQQGDAVQLQVHHSIPYSTVATPARRCSSTSGTSFHSLLHSCYSSKEMQFNFRYIIPFPTPQLLLQQGDAVQLQVNHSIPYSTVSTSARRCRSTSGTSFHSLLHSFYPSKEMQFNFRYIIPFPTPQLLLQQGDTIQLKVHHSIPYSTVATSARRCHLT
jgi:FtsP/CotA-like multicopper oxidase with cupredoxin domain